jgi:HEAT repeat protein
MSKELNTVTWVFLITTIILAGNLSVCAASPAQSDAEAKIAVAVALFRSGEVQKAVADFRNIGDPAVPAALELLRADVGWRGMPQVLLSGFIASTTGARADAALIELLSNDSPYLRGFAAASVGKRRLKASVPKLIELLRDKDVYLTTHITHPHGYDREPLSADVSSLVRDAAIDALELVAGKRLARNQSRPRQAEAWLRWWQKQNARK